MSITTALTGRAAAMVDRRTSRRGFLGRTAVVGSALTVAAPTYVLRPGTAYAAVTRTRCADCGSGLCCDGYTEFCCHLRDDGVNDCPPGTVLAGWWKVDNSDFCFGTARYYMDCNKESPGCGCGSSGACQDDYSQCGCVDCQSRKDGCTVFRYGNCHNEIACVGPIMCRVVTCTKPWEIEPTCSQVPRTDERTRHHHRPCLERDSDDRELAFIQALYEDFLGRPSDPTGEAYWGNVLVRGAHLDDPVRVRDVVARSFAFSDEYVDFVIKTAYQDLLGRAPAKTELEFWADEVHAGMAPAELAVELLGSEEFFDAAHREQARFVNRLYRRVLGRDAGESEKAHWVEVMAAGQDRRDVAALTYGSLESRRLRVQQLYQRFLGREAEDGGRDYWADVLTSAEDITLALYLARSDEYVDRAESRFPGEQDEPDPDGELVQ